MTTGFGDSADLQQGADSSIAPSDDRIDASAKVDQGTVDGSNHIGDRDDASGVDSTMGAVDAVDDGRGDARDVTADDAEASTDLDAASDALSDASVDGEVEQDATADAQPDSDTDDVTTDAWRDGAVCDGAEDSGSPGDAPARSAQDRHSDLVSP